MITFALWSLGTSNNRLPAPPPYIPRQQMINWSLLLYMFGYCGKCWQSALSMSSLQWPNLLSVIHFGVSRDWIQGLSYACCIPCHQVPALYGTLTVGKGNTTPTQSKLFPAAKTKWLRSQRSHRCYRKQRKLGFSIRGPFMHCDLSTPRTSRRPSFPFQNKEVRLTIPGSKSRGGGYWYPTSFLTHPTPTSGSQQKEQAK